MSLVARRSGFAWLLSFAVLALASAAVSAADLEVVVLDVGQGDAIVVNCPDGEHHLLIDAGDTRYPGSSAAFRHEMQTRFPEGGRHLDIVVASHPHLDHIGSMKWVLENFDVDTYVDNGQKVDTATFGRLEKLRRKLTNDGELTYISGRESSLEEVDFCPQLKLELIEPWAMANLSDTNDRSVGVRLEHGDVTFLFVGDMEMEAENVLLNELSSAEQERLLDVDVLKVGHHGSHSSTTAPFVRAVSPTHALISCGKKGVGTNAGYKHPRSVTVGTLNDALHDHATHGRIWAYDKQNDRWTQKSRREGIWVTPRDGTITVRSNGQAIQVEVERD
jgi:beta-lactamase superfamily II metal-dependent hydrolase